jgi:aminoglycoside phosphotransferase (APT) family kinase protein
MTDADPAVRELIAKLVHDAVGESVLDFEQVVGHGVSNDVYYVTTERGERVLRATKAAEGLSNYRKEAWCMKATATLFPGPIVLGMDTTDGWSFMVETRIQGTVASARSENALHVWRRLGEYAARLREVPVEGYGFHLTEQGNGVFRDTWPDIADWYLDFLFDDPLLVELGALGPGQLPRARRLVERIGRWRFDPSLCHGNLSLDNAIIGDDGVVHVIDWGTAEASRGPHFDVADVATWETPDVLSEFVAGLGLTSTQWAAIEPDVDALVLRRALDSVKWSNARGHLTGRDVAIARAHADRILGSL